MSIAAMRIQNEFQVVLKENGNILKYVGTGISRDKKLPPKKMLEVIARKLAVPANLAIRSMAASYINWADPNGKVLVSGKYGVLQDHPSIANRQYFKCARQEPWVLKTAPLSKSLFSDDIVLPITLGVESSEKVFLGYLGLGLRIENIRPHLDGVIDKRKIDYIILDKNKNIIFAPPNVSIDIKLFDPVFLSSSKMKGWLKKPIVINNISYSYHKKIEGYPYIVIIGYNEAYKEQRFTYHILPKLYQFLIIAFFCIVFVFFFKKIVINPISALSRYAALISNGKTDIKMPKQYSLEMYNLAKGLLLVNRYIKKNARSQQKLELAEKIAQSSDLAKEEFVKSLNKDFEHPIKTILSYIDVLLNNTSKNEALKLNKEQLLECLNKIKDAALQINYKTFNSLDLDYFDINELLEQCAQINLKEAFSRKINMIISLEEKIPSIYADRLKIKQIIASLLYESINNLPSLHEITLSSQLTINKGIKYVKISIKDNGFGLAEEEIYRIHHNLGINNKVSFLSIMFLDPYLIKKVVEMHGGKYSFYSKRHEGTIITITLPIYAKKEDPINIDTKENKSNIHYLTQMLD